MKKTIIFQLLFVVMAFMSCNSNESDSASATKADSISINSDLAARNLRTSGVPPQFADCDKCNLDSTIDWVVDHHRISRDSFYQQVAAYYATTDINIWEIPAPYVRTKDQIWTLIHGDDSVFCKRNSIKFFIDPDHPNTQTGMRLDVDSVCSSDCADWQHFSITLLKGVINKYHITRFDFMRMHDCGTNKPTMGFIAYDLNTPVYYGDLTNDFP